MGNDKDKKNQGLEIILRLVEEGKIKPEKAQELLNRQKEQGVQGPRPDYSLSTRTEDKNQENQDQGSNVGSGSSNDIKYEHYYPERKSHTVRNFLIMIPVLTTLVVGGAFAVSKYMIHRWWGRETKMTLEEKVGEEHARRNAVHEEENRGQTKAVISFKSYHRPDGEQVGQTVVEIGGGDNNENEYRSSGSEDKMNEDRSSEDRMNEDRSGNVDVGGVTKSSAIDWKYWDYYEFESWKKLMGYRKIAVKVNKVFMETLNYRSKETAEKLATGTIEHYLIADISARSLKGSVNIDFANAFSVSSSYRKRQTRNGDYDGHVLYSKLNPGVQRVVRYGLGRFSPPSIGDEHEVHAARETAIRRKIPFHIGDDDVNFNSSNNSYVHNFSPDHSGVIWLHFSGDSVPIYNLDLRSRQWLEPE